MRSSYLLLASLVAAPLAAQYSTDFESLNASAAGTLITGQDGFYVPVAGSLDGLVVTYAGNTFGVPVNPNGGNKFYVGVSQLTNVFARAQRAVTLPTNSRIYITYDVCCNYMGVGTPANNVGSFSFQPSNNSTYVNLLARWPVGAIAPPPTWNADVVAGSGTPPGTVTVVLGDPAFQGLATNVWHTWGVTIDMATGQHIDFRITNGVTNVTTVYVPPTPVLLPIAGSPILPTDFRFFTGGSENLFAIDNLRITYGAGYTTFGAGCVGSMGVPTLAAVGNSVPALGTTFQGVLGNLPLSLGVVTTGLSDTLALGSVPLPFSLAGNGFPGCNLLVDPAVSQFLIGSGNTANWTFTVPMVPAFAGLTLYNQGVSLESSGPGAAFTNGGRGVVGF